MSLRQNRLDLGRWWYNSDQLYATKRLWWKNSKKDGKHFVLIFFSVQNTNHLLLLSATTGAANSVLWFNNYYFFLFSEDLRSRIRWSISKRTRGSKGKSKIIVWKRWAKIPARASQQRFAKIKGNISFPFVPFHLAQVSGFCTKKLMFVYFLCSSCSYVR